MNNEIKLVTDLITKLDELNEKLTKKYVNYCNAEVVVKVEYDVNRHLIMVTIESIINECDVSIQVSNGFYFEPFVRMCSEDKKMLKKLDEYKFPTTLEFDEQIPNDKIINVVVDMFYQCVDLLGIKLSCKVQK